MYVFIKLNIFMYYISYASSMQADIYSHECKHMQQIMDGMMGLASMQHIVSWTFACKVRL